MTEDGLGASPGPRPLHPDLGSVLDAVTTAEAAGFVTVGADADRRYLTGLDASTPGGIVVVPGDGVRPPRATLCVPPGFHARARAVFVDAALDEPRPTDENQPSAHAFHDGVVRRVVADSEIQHIGRAVAAVLADEQGRTDASDEPTAHTDAADGPTVIVPRSIPHDAALYLERAGFTVSSTTAVRDGRARKRPAAVECIRRVQRAAAAAMARVETTLARTRVGRSNDTDDRHPVCRLDGEALTTDRLRRIAHTTLAAHGVDSTHTVVAPGVVSAAQHPPICDAMPIRPGVPVVVSITPRGPSGYHGRLTRTFVVDGDGGWDRRAYVAVEAAQAAALAEADPGVVAGTVHEEAVAEIAAYGFDPMADRSDPGYIHDTGGGIGVSPREPPLLTGDTALRPGHTLVVEPGVSDPAHGGVRLGDVAVVTEDGAERLVEYPFATTPEMRSLDQGDGPADETGV